MVISFSVKEARDQLMNKGEVNTFRWKKRKKTGKNWANEKRGGKKIADVFIGEARLIETVSDLDPYLSKSGFKTRKEWVDVIMSMKLPPFYMIGYLYKVSNCDSCGWYHSANNRCCYLDNQCKWTTQESQQLRTDQNGC